MCVCARCDSKIKLERKIIDGKILCRSCFDIVIEEKKKGYKHRPKFNTLSDHCCLCCGVDLCLLEPSQVKKINQYEYCDVCAEKIKSVFDELKGYLLSLNNVIDSLDFDDENYIVTIKGKNKTLDIYVEDEISMYFWFDISEWHSHYDLEEKSDSQCNDLSTFYYELSAILYNELCVAFYVNEKRKCVFSELINESELNEDVLRVRFGTNKKIHCSFWDSKYDKVFNV